jgi:retron-type reverse transcriptase
VARPISAADGPVTRVAPSALNVGRTYWPRCVKQLIKVGSGWPSPDTFLHLYSFPSVASLKLVSDRAAEGDGDLSLTDLGLAIGISPGLLTSCIHGPKGHYRHFTIQKRGGGDRLISAPRIFLKTVQYWLLDYFLDRLPLHPCSHAYQVGKSIVTNASVHVGKKYVANVDIKDFFPSIRPDLVAAMLEQHGIGPQLAATIARLSSLENGLPQGAPTSPRLSNAYMFDVDGMMRSYCEPLRMTYTRYADDITFSGDNRRNILGAIERLESQLRKKGLRLNQEKTRIASVASQQKVTGVVVNAKAQPSRVFLRRVRAMLHKAEVDPATAIPKLAELRGYVSYLNAFPALQDSAAMRRYRTVLADLPKS